MIASIVASSAIAGFLFKRLLKGSNKYSEGLIPIQWVDMQPTNPNNSGYSIAVFIAESAPMLAPIIPRLLLSKETSNFCSIAGINVFTINKG